ncbi:hypothetical protein Sjap_023275 [Stephania japonica]|uniref:NTF2 domain-containing protein n=1 Tax=Stephania japonica TaxID=461633 RepID=A0AAP0EIJ9_9MAGN
MDPDALAKAFVEHYYTTFDANRANLASLYQEQSMLTFEGQKIQGAPNIVSKLTSLPFQQCQHSVSTVDCQPSGPSGGMLVFVSGNLQLLGESHALKFSQIVDRISWKKLCYSDIFFARLKVIHSLSFCIPIGMGIHAYECVLHDAKHVSFDADSSRKLLCVERYIPPELCLRMRVRDVFSVICLFECLDAQRSLS